MHGGNGDCNDLCGAGLLNDGNCRPETKGQQLRDLGGSTVSGCSGCCDDKSDRGGVTPKETRLLKEKSEQ